MMQFKHPLHDIFKQQKIVIDALLMLNLTKPVQMKIINGVASHVMQEPDEYEKILYRQLDYIDEKIRLYNRSIGK